MLKHIYLILVATFIFGFITGFILWFFNHTGAEADSTVADQTSVLSITAQAFGGCESFGCASYKITDEGGYTFIVRPPKAAEIRKTGTVEAAAFASLKSVLKKTNFDLLETTQFTGTCPITYEGLAFKYSIEYKKKSYMFDSCKQNLKGEQLFEDLNKYFNVFQTQGV